LTAFLVRDDGREIPAPKYLRKMERKLILAQRKLDKKRKGSSNYEKMRHRVAVLHQKVKNQRKHFLHVQSFRLIYENQVIYVEDLHVAGMIRNHCLAKSIADASWSKFVTYVLYKAEWYGREVVFIDRFAPSSKLCSECGNVNDELMLHERMWCCKICHTEHDRDINAAKNIKKLGQGIVRSKKPEERTAYTFLAKEKQAGSRIQEPFLRKQDAR
jgi:putative transposase